MIAGDLKQLFGKAIRSKRSELGISQEELADRAGLHRTYISDVERGARNLSLESIEKLAHALELSVTGLFARTGDGVCAPTVEVLLVEDEPDDIELALRAFRKARFANPVHVVHDGAEALDFVFATGAHTQRRHSPLPGIILLDLKLPGMNGLECLRRLKADARTREIPVIVLTSSQHDGDIAECRRLGVESYIVKPVDFRNFSDITPQLRFEWALMKRAPDEPQ
ncbi:MAG TPA: response regulator [Chthoniobacteraceae bacterium]|nr:response regulator [Chthoniobacteraceae bacterium]